MSDKKSFQKVPKKKKVDGDENSFEDCLSDISDLNDFYDSYEEMGTLCTSLKLTNQFESFHTTTKSTTCDDTFHKNGASDDDSSESSGYCFDHGDDENEFIISDTELNEEKEKYRTHGEKEKLEKCSDSTNVSTSSLSDMDSIRCAIHKNLDPILGARSTSSDSFSLTTVKSSPSKSSESSSTQDLTTLSSETDSSVEEVNCFNYRKTNNAQKKKVSFLFPPGTEETFESKVSHPKNANDESKLELDLCKMSLELAQALTSLDSARRKVGQHSIEILKLNSMITSLKLENQVLSERVKQYEQKTVSKVGNFVQRFEDMSRTNSQLNSHKNTYLRNGDEAPRRF